METRINGPPLPFINCFLCRQHFDTPKVLACWHTFCLKCLENIIPENSITLVCPTCFMPSILPKRGPHGLPDNWLLNHSSVEKFQHVDSNIESCSSISSIQPFGYSTKLNDHHDFPKTSSSGETNKMTDSGYCEWPAKTSLDGCSTGDEKERLTHSLPTAFGIEAEKHSIQDTASSSAIMIDDSTTAVTSRSIAFSPRSIRSSPDFLNKASCRLHPHKPVVSYCCQWELPLCSSCPADGHSKHKHLSLDLAILRQRKELDSIVKLLKQKLETLNLNKSFLQRTKTELDKNFINAKQNASLSFECLQQYFLDRFKRCLEEMDASYEHKSGVLDEQMKILDETVIDTKRYYHLLENVYDCERNEAILLANKMLRDKRDANESQINESLRPAETSFIEFDKGNVAALMKSMGGLSFLVSEKQTCSDAIILFKDDLNKHHFEGKLIKLSLYLVGDGQKSVENFRERLFNSLYAEVLLPNKNRIVPTVLFEHLGPKLGELQFVVNGYGPCKVEVFCFGCPINGSPFEIFVSKTISSHPPRTRQTLEKTKSFPATTTRTSIPISIRSIGSKLPIYKTSNLGTSRPPWNSSSHLSSFLQRSFSSLTMKPSLAAKPATNNKHQSLTDLSRSLPPDPTSSLKFYDSLLVVKRKIELEEKIEEEPELCPDANEDHNPKVESNVNRKVTGTTKLSVGRLASSRTTTKRELPTLQRCLSNAEALQHKSLSRTLSLRYPQKINQKDTSACRIIGRKGTKAGEFLHVQGVSYKDGVIAATDSKTRFVQLFSYKTGLVVARLGVQVPSCRSSLSSPIGITQDSQGFFFVSDFGKGYVFVFDRDGRQVKKIGQDNLLGPKGILLDTQDHLLVVDTKSCSVHTYCSQTGKLLKKFGSRGYNDTELCGPHFCALTPDGKNVAISDFGRGKVKVYSLEGNLLQSFGCSGPREGQLKKPTGIAIDPKSGHIIVADFESSKLKIFNSHGHFLKTVDTSSQPLSGPLGLSLTHDGHVIVADSGNHCLKVFSY